MTDKLPATIYAYQMDGYGGKFVRNIVDAPPDDCAEYVAKSVVEGLVSALRESAIKRHRVGHYHAGEFDVCMWEDCVRARTALAEWEKETQ